MPVSIAQLMTMDSAGIHACGQELTSKATQLNGQKGQFTGATDIGDAWKGLAGDAAKAQAQAVALAAGNACQAIANSGIAVKALAQAVDAAKGRIDAQRAVIASKGLPIQPGPDGKYVSITRDQALAPAPPPPAPPPPGSPPPPPFIAKPGWPPDTPTRFDEYAADVTRANNEMDAAKGDFDRKDLECKEAVKASSDAMKAAAEAPTVISPNDAPPPPVNIQPSAPPPGVPPVIQAQPPPPPVEAQGPQPWNSPVTESVPPPPPPGG